MFQILNQVKSIKYKINISNNIIFYILKKIVGYTICFILFYHLNFVQLYFLIENIDRRIMFVMFSFSKILKPVNLL